MNEKSTHLIIFIIGAVVGSIITQHYVKKKYEQISQEEIDSVKKAFSKPDIEDYETKVRECGYTNYSNMDAENQKCEKSESTKKPYVIAPDEFGDVDDYEKIGLTYYSDCILADDNDELVEDADNVIGLDSLTHFGEYEADSVFVRNERLKCDFEILLDKRTYSSVTKSRPH